MSRNQFESWATKAIGIDHNGADRRLNVAAERLITDTEGAAILCCSKATWWRRVADGTIPRPIKLGHASRWPLSEILAVIERAKAARDGAE